MWCATRPYATLKMSLRHVLVGHPGVICISHFLRIGYRPRHCSLQRRNSIRSRASHILWSIVIDPSIRLGFGFRRWYESVRCVASSKLGSYPGRSMTAPEVQKVDVEGVKACVSRDGGSSKQKWRIWIWTTMHMSRTCLRRHNLRDP